MFDVTDDLRIINSRHTKQLIVNLRKLWSMFNGEDGALQHLESPSHDIARLSLEDLKSLFHAGFRAAFGHSPAIFAQSFLAQLQQTLLRQHSAMNSYSAIGSLFRVLKHTYDAFGYSVKRRGTVWRLAAIVQHEVLVLRVDQEAIVNSPVKEDAVQHKGVSHLAIRVFDALLEQLLDGDLLEVHWQLLVRLQKRVGPEF